MSSDNHDVHQKNYDEIMKLYDFAEQLVDTVEDENTEDPVDQLSIVEPIIEDIEAATDVLAEEYREFALHGKKPNLISKRRIENALRTIYLALKKGKEQTEKREKEEVAMQNNSSSYKSIFGIFNRLQEHIKKLFSMLRHQMNIELKDYHYSRSGRQEGNVLGAGKKDNSNAE